MNARFGVESLRGPGASKNEIQIEKRFEMLPDVPTVKEQGIDFVMGMWRGLVAPKGTPADAMKK
ncbi:MAG TPA: tripartite tricarboxylate transporter substrate-binding protein [Thermodesulfobacteriota bacterium]|nr:tripartite tricarboxylate transporter substrate-binding protein [Thermodesulfobacteriota bacterium]